MPILLLFLFVTLSATAQVYPDTAWSSPCPTDTLTPRPTRCWQGLQFIFLPDVYEKSPYPVSRRRDTADYVSYEEAVGKIATVGNVSFSEGYWTMELVLPDSTIYHVKNAETMGWEPQLDRLAWMGDLEYARSKYLNRTVWSFFSMPKRSKQPRTVNGIPIPVPDVMLAEPREPGLRYDKPVGRQYQPMRIISVEPSPYSFAPIMFTLRSADGNTGSIYVQISGTNAGNRVASSHTEFHTEDPRRRFRWKAAIWRKIERGFVESGMTTDQVRLSWGKPAKIESSESGETWFYSPGDLLTFRHGILVEIHLQPSGLPEAPDFSE